MHKFLLLCSILLCLTGCMDFHSSPISLVTLPEKSEQQEELSEIVKQALPERTVPILPQRTEQDKITFLYSGKERIHAAVFFQNENEYGNISMRLFSYMDNHWSKTGELSLNGNDVHMIQTEDLNRDGVDELMVTTESFDEYQKNLFVISFSPENKWSLMEVGKYHQFIAGTISEKAPLLYTLHFDRNVSAKLSAYKMTEKMSLELVSEIPLDEFVNGYEVLRLGKINEVRDAIFLDASQGANSAQTQIVTWNKNKLEKATDEVDFPLYKPRFVYSEDINEDGIIEIGSLYEPSGWEDVPLAEMRWIHAYYQLTSNKSFLLVHERYVDFENGFYINFPDEWRQKTTFSRNDISDALTIINTKSQEELLRIRWLPADAAPLNRSKWLPILKTPTMIYYIPNENKFMQYKHIIHLVSKLKGER
ncbi:hypothetical protein ABN702_05520 [Bacillus haimaensis]|uniref:hypothetical protein n=1 Tax=Bacillus haimaensis TaxID=3160967 RepID=UPI003AA88832